MVRTSKLGYAIAFLGIHIDNLKMMLEKDHVYGDSEMLMLREIGVNYKDIKDFYENEAYNGAINAISDTITDKNHNELMIAYSKVTEDGIHVSGSSSLEFDMNLAYGMCKRLLYDLRTSGQFEQILLELIKEVNDRV